MSYTVVGDCFNTKWRISILIHIKLWKRTDTHKHIVFKRTSQLKKALWLLVIRKKLVNNQNFKGKSRLHCIDTIAYHCIKKKTCKIQIHIILMTKEFFMVKVFKSSIAESAPRAGRHTTPFVRPLKTSQNQLLGIALTIFSFF